VKRIAFALVIVGLAGRLPAQAPHAFVPIAGEPFRGTLRAVYPAAAPEQAPVVEIALANGDTRRIGLDFLRRIDLRERAGARAPLAPSLWLRSGQTLPARLLAGEGAAGRFRLPFSACEPVLPWRFFAALRLATERSDDGGFAAALGERPDKDLLYALREGAVVRLSVDFVAIDGDRLRVRFAGQDQELPVSRTYGLVFARGAGAAPDRGDGPRAMLQLDDAAVGGRLLSVAGERWSLALDEGAVLELETARIASVAVVSDRLVYLSDLPARGEQTAAFDLTWPWLVDRGPGGGPIRLVDGREVARGLVLFPRTQLTYELGGRFDVFKATIGMEQHRGENAHACFRVLADGKNVFEADGVAADTPPQDIEVKVAGAQRLTLEADFGKNFDLGDVCVFGDARVMRQ
jgi:hypothetical protein